MSEHDPRHAEDPDLPMPWEDPFYDTSDAAYDGNDGASEEWPPRRSAWNGEGWPGPEDFWP